VAFTFLVALCIDWQTRNDNVGQRIVGAGRDRDLPDVRQTDRGIDVELSLQQTCDAAIDTARVPRHS
jgi:hypothetical protein